MEYTIRPSFPWSRVLTELAWPALIPILLIVGWHFSPWTLVDVHPSMPATFVVLWITGVVLSWRLHRTRVVFAAFALGFIQQGLLSGINRTYPTRCKWARA